MTTLLLGAAVLVVAAPRRGSESDVILAFTEVPASYAIQYRTTQPDGSVATQVLRVDRPWRSVATSETSRQLSDFGLVSAGPTGGASVSFTVLPALAAGDARPDIVLAAALEADLAHTEGQRVVAGLACQVYVTGLPLDAGPLMARGDAVIESCVDERGLVLDERHLVEGVEILRRTAVDVVVPAPRAQEEQELPAPALSVDAGGAALAPVSIEKAREIARWELADPQGFDLRGTYATVHPEPAVEQDPLAGFTRLASVTWVWERGVDVVVFETGAYTDGSPVQHPAGGIEFGDWPADGASPGPTQLYLSARGNELRHGDPEGFVRLLGTVTPAELASIAAGISRTEGTL